MTPAGWYPDPDGTPGRYRYWDGGQWSPQTSQDPYAAPPTHGAQPSPRPTKRRNNVGLLIGGLAVVLVLAVIITLVVRSLNDHRDTVLDDPDPPPVTASGWDDSSPLPTASPTPSRSPKPSPSASDPGDDASIQPQGQVSCANGDPGFHPDHPQDGRKYGGDLSFAPPAGWDDGESYASGISWSYDTDGVHQTTEPGWAALLAVGEIHAEDGFKTPKQAAGAMMQCIASSAYYSSFVSRKDVFSKAVTVDGHPGWALRTEIRVDNLGLSVDGDVAEVIVVDTGEKGRLSFFGGFVPIGDQLRAEQRDRCIASLQVD